MQLTKGAIGNLINRYTAVLKKCHLMNTFGSLAVAGMLVMGGAGVAVAGAAGGTTEPAAKSQIVITNTSENKALTGTYEGYENEKGGVISVTTGATGVTITDATFDGNTANFGGAIWNEGTLTVNGGSFEGNTANVAGAIYNAAEATLTVDGVTFANNSSVNNVAGAINNRDGKVAITNSTFTGNDSGPWAAVPSTTLRVIPGSSAPSPSRIPPSKATRPVTAALCGTAPTAKSPSPTAPSRATRLWLKAASDRAAPSPTPTR